MPGLFFGNASSSLVTTRYWVGGTASWNGTAGSKWAFTSGGSGGAPEPTANNNVFFDANSGASTVTVATTTGLCKSLNFSGFTGTLNGSTGVNLAASLTLYSGMTYSHTGTLTFTATSTGKTITTDGISISSPMTFNGVGGDWTLQDNVTTSADITQTNGTLSTGNKSITGVNMLVAAGTWTLNLGSSTITLSGNWASNSSDDGTTLNAGTSNITIAGELAAGQQTFYNVTFTKTSSTVSGLTGAPCTFHNFVFANSSGYATFSLDGNITVSNNFTVTGNNATTQRVFLTTNTAGPRTITCNGTISVTNMDLRGTAFAGSGAASPVTGTSLGNCGGFFSANVTFDTPITMYWKHPGTASQDYFDSNWYTASGGSTPAARSPLPQDVAVFDVNSFGAAGKTVTIPGYRIPSLVLTGVLNSPTITATDDWGVMGDITLISGMTMTSGNGSVRTFAASVITSAGKNLGCSLTLDALGAEASLADDLLLPATATFRNRATNFASMNFNISVGKMDIGGTYSGGFDLGTTTISLTGTGIVFNAVGTFSTFNGDAFTLKLTNNSASNKIIQSDPDFPPNYIWGNFWNATAGNGICIINGYSRFSDFKIDAGRTQQFEAGKTQSFETFTANGSLGNLILIQSSTAANHDLVSLSATPVACTFMDISRSQASGADFIATLSVDSGNNSGWIIS